MKNRSNPEKLKIITKSKRISRSVHFSIAAIVSITVSILGNLFIGALVDYLGPSVETITILLFFILSLLILKKGLERESVILVAFALLLFGSFIAVSGYVSQYGYRFSFKNLVKDFYANGSTELISIAIAVFAIDSLRDLREERREADREVQMSRLEAGLAMSAASQAAHLNQLEANMSTLSRKRTTISLTILATTAITAFGIVVLLSRKRLV